MARSGSREPHRDLADRVVKEFSHCLESTAHNYPAYCPEHDCEGSIWADGSGSCSYCRVVEQACDCVPQMARVALVPVPEDERMVVVVTEGGKWPEEQVEAISDIIDQWESGGFNIMWQAVRAILNALADMGERSSERTASPVSDVSTSEMSA